MSQFAAAADDIAQQLAKIRPAALQAAIEAATQAIHDEIEADPVASPRMRQALHDVVGYRIESEIPQAGSRWINGHYVAVVGLGVGPGYYARRRRVVDRGNRKGGVGISGANIHWAAVGTADRYTGQRTSWGKVKETKNRRRYSGAMMGLKVVSRASSRIAVIIDAIEAEVDRALNH